MKLIIPLALFSLGLFLAGCGTIQTLAPAAAAAPETEIVVQETAGLWAEQTPLMDEQGAVTVGITPLNLESPGETLDFEVSLETHSVELSMDLAGLATLTTKGQTVQALKWDAPLGGHHVSGILSFPAAADGVAVLEGASSFTITIVDVDAPVRVFTWKR